MWLSVLIAILIQALVVIALHVTPLSVCTRFENLRYMNMINFCVQRVVHNDFPNKFIVRIKMSAHMPIAEQRRVLCPYVLLTMDVWSVMVGHYKRTPPPCSPMYNVYYIVHSTCHTPTIITKCTL